MPGLSRLLLITALWAVNSNVLAQTEIDSGFGASGKIIVMVLVIVFLFLLRYQFGAGKSASSHQASSGHIRLVSTLTLGMREKLAVIDVGGQRVLIGIAQGNIRTLAQLQAPVATESTEQAVPLSSGGFSRILQKMMS